MSRNKSNYREMTLGWLFLLLTTAFSCEQAKTKNEPLADPITEVVLLFTNDFESAFDPIPAYWRDDIEYLGGAAELTTMIDSIRQAEEIVYLFDAGDMFTGTLSNRTQGELLMEMMITMGYDAMAIGNHEFDYGWRNFRKQMFRVPFPMLGCNIFYKDSSIPFSQPSAVIEKNGFRVGVIGAIGQDARSVVIASNVDSLDFLDPIPAVRAEVDKLKGQVDLMVVLTHQGKTGPMQTDQEEYPELWRDFEEDIALSGSIPGIDVHFGGHAHRGIDPPYVHPETGTIIMQTFGHGTRLGYLKLQVNTQTNRVISQKGQLLEVVSDRYTPDPVMTAKLEQYRNQYPELQKVVCQTEDLLVRKYNQESDLGNLFSDILREAMQVDVTFFNSGGIRADLPKGEVTVAHMLDAFPFQDRIWVMKMTGKQIKEVLEQGFTLERGIIQVSGLQARYNPSGPKGNRLLDLSIAGKPVNDEAVFTIATIGVIAEGGDLYKTFTEAEVVENQGPYFSEILENYLREKAVIEIPESGRLIAEN